jgi:hypothetical protein
MYLPNPWIVYRLSGPPGTIQLVRVMTLTTNLYQANLVLVNVGGGHRADSAASSRRQFMVDDPAWLRPFRLNEDHATLSLVLTNVPGMKCVKCLEISQEK